MTQAALFEDVELWATGYMRAALGARGESYAAGVKVDNKVPSPRPARLVQFRRDGGPQLGPNLEAARLGVNVWAPSEAEANNLAALVRALLSQAAGAKVNGRDIKKVTTTGPSPVPESDAIHKYLTAEVFVRGSALT